MLKGFTLAWTSVPWCWLVILVFSVFVAVRARQEPLAVGAEWLQVGKTWVRLYELTKITAKHRSSAIHIDFEDSAGREVLVQADDLQKNREMWDLVYNGILHSVIAGGAKPTVSCTARSACPAPKNRPEQVSWQPNELEP